MTDDAPLGLVLIDDGELSEAEERFVRLTAYDLERGVLIVSHPSPNDSGVAQATARSIARVLLTKLETVELQRMEYNDATVQICGEIITNDLAALSRSYIPIEKRRRMPLDPAIMRERAREESNRSRARAKVRR